MQIKLHEHIPGTIQGEGTHTGRYCDFVRIYGCSVGCWFCDTGYSPNKKHGSLIQWSTVEAEEFIDELTTDFIVITGGEPFSWPRLPDFCNLLIANGHEVSVETSGIKWRDIPSKVWVTLSPKEHVKGVKYKTAKTFWDRADEIKIVVSDTDDFYHYYHQYTRQLRKPFFLQPEYSTDISSANLIKGLMTTHPNIRLSSQMHKYLNLP
jgi:organic radical activating enzyme